MRSPGSQRALDALWWLVRFLAALFFFVGALQVMKTGAAELDILKHGGLLVRNAMSTLGLGWLVPYLRRNIGTVLQDFKLLSDKTVFQNVAFALEVIGKQKHIIDARVPEILELVGLGDKLNSYPNELSGGEQQRVSIARAVVNRPLVLLADEPTGNLDPQTSVDIMRLLDKVNRIGTTIVMATHDQAIVDAMRRRVVELDDGRIVRDQARGVYT